MIHNKVLSGDPETIFLDPNGVLRIGDCVCVMRAGRGVRPINEKDHGSKYSIHPRSQNYHDLKQHYLWCGMKKEIIEFVAMCMDF